MAAPNRQRQPAGFRHCRMYALDANNYPAATATTAYEGVEVTGPRTLDVTEPEPRQIVKRGNDKVWQLDMLPADAPMSGTLNVAHINDDVDALLTDDLAFTVAEAPMMLINSDNRGDENTIGVLAYAQSQDMSGGSDDGARRWDFLLFPKVLINRQESGYGEAEQERAYTFFPQFVASHIWGTSFSANVEGSTRAQAVRGVAQYKPHIVAFQGDGTTTAFLFHADRPAAATGKVAVWDAGVLQTQNFTVFTTGVTFSSAPTSDNIVVCFIEIT